MAEKKNVKQVAEQVPEPVLVKQVPYTTEELIARLEKGTYDDVVAAGYKGTQHQFNIALAKLLNSVE